MKKYIGIIFILSFVGCLVDMPHGTIAPDSVLRIVMGGDSNTKFGCANFSPTWPHCQETLPSWVDYLTTLDAGGPLNTLTFVNSHVFDNEGLSGSTACHITQPQGADGTLADQIPYLLASSPDVLILSYGTNDLHFGVAIEDIISCYQAAYQQAYAANAIVFIALTPPQFGTNVTDAMVQTLNTRLVQTFGTRQTLDFYTGVTVSSLYPDGIHATDAEQHRRAQIVYDALQAWPNR